MIEARKVQTMRGKPGIILKPLLGAVSLLLVGLAATTTAWAWRRQGAAKSPPSGPRVSFERAGVSLVRPQGFTNAASFDGFEQASSGASVLVIRLPGPFSEATRGFNAPAMKARGMRLVSRRIIAVGGGKGDNKSGGSSSARLLLQVAQVARGETFSKWIVAMGDERETVLVTATFPQNRASALSAPLRAAALSVRRLPAAVKTTKGEDNAGLGWSLSDTATGGKLKRTQAVGKMIAFTRDGAIPAASPRDPLFVAAPSLGSGGVAGDRSAWAQRRFEQIAQTANIQITSQESVTLGGLPGWETVGEGRDQKTGTPLTLYQAVIFEKAGGYIVMQGLVGQAESETYLPVFKAVARSFKPSR